MQSRSIYTNLASVLAVLLLTMAGCKKEEYALPTPKEGLQNDAIKRTIGPSLVGEPIEFAYAMALLPTNGKLVSAQVEASIEGAAGTYLEHRSFHTKNDGTDVGVEVALPSVNQKGITSVTFNKDTSAATLRYYYVVPEEARGKTVSFTFSAKSSNGESVSYKMGPYNISKMDVVKGLTVTNAARAFISIADMAVYTAAEATGKEAKIDLVYLYRSFTTSTFNHALVSPGADPQYLPDVTLPAGMSNSTKVQKVFNLQDYNLQLVAPEQRKYGIYVDDQDFEKLDLGSASNLAIDLKAESGVWVETADKKYRAYIFVNSVNNGGKSAVISIKRYAL